MPLTRAPRPTFLLRPIIEATGGPRPASYVAETVSPKTYDNWWQALAPLTAALTLAGYDCPEILIARGSSTARHTRLLCWPGTEDRDVFVDDVEVGIHSELDWTQLTGADADFQIFERYFLRVAPRRSLLEPANLASPRPPLPLDGLLANFVQPDGAPAGDGWLLYDQRTTVTPGTEHTVPGQFAAAARTAAEAVIDAQLDAFRQGRADIGILRVLDPATWDSALGLAHSVRPFAEVAEGIWRWLQMGDNLRQTLMHEPLGSGDPLKSLHGFAALETQLPEEAISCLKARRLRLHPKDATLELALSSLESSRYLFLLYQLHEYGLIRLFPWPVTPAIFQPAPELRAFPPVDLTGAYITPRVQTDAQGNPLRPVIATLQLNQAGDYLEGWWADGELRRTDIKAWLQTPWEGASTLTFVGTSFTIDLVPAEDADAIELRITLGGTSYGMTRVDRRARLAPDVIAESLPEELRENLTTSIDALVAPVHIRANDGFQLAISILLGDVMAMGAGTLEYAEIADTGTSVRAALYDNGAISTRSGPPPPSPMLERFRLVARRELAAHQVSEDDTCLEQLQAVFADQEAISMPLQELLALHVEEHRYPYVMLAGGLGGEVKAMGGLEAGVFAFTMALHHDDACGAGAHGWPAEDYLGGLWEAGASGGVGGGLRAKLLDTGSENVAVTEVEWDQADWDSCAFFVAEYSVTGTFGIVEGAPALPQAVAKATGLEGTEVEDFIFVGRKGRSVAIGNSSGWSASLGPGVGAAISFGVTGKLGAIFGRWNGSEFVRPKEVISYEEDLRPGTTLTLEAFKADEWTLEEWMLVALQRSVARYRALFESPTGVLDIEGDTSTTAPDQYNEPLSFRRALSAFAWIRLLLSTAPLPPRPPLEVGQPSRPALGTTSGLAIDPDRVAIAGKGELKARMAEVADEVEIPEWRQIAISINDQALVML